MARKSSFRKASPGSVFANPAAAISIAFSLLSGLVVSAPASADATVYHCGPKDSQWFSQIPCEEDSEAVLIKDQHPLGSEAATPESAGEAAGPAAGPSNNTQAFINQLEKQRAEQLAEIDRDIDRLQHPDASLVEGESDAVSAEETAALLADLQNTRASILSEYDAMIQAAKQRIAQP